jgi:cell division protein FtsB
MRVIRFKRFDYVVSMGCMTMLAYFAWQAFYSPRGYPYRDQLIAHIELLTKQRDEINGQRNSFESRVALMRPESIDPDMLDELVRKDLGMVKSTDVVVEFAK